MKCQLFKLRRRQKGSPRTPHRGGSLSPCKWSNRRHRCHCNKTQRGSMRRNSCKKWTYQSSPHLKSASVSQKQQRSRLPQQSKKNRLRQQQHQRPPRLRVMLRRLRQPQSLPSGEAHLSVTMTIGRLLSEHKWAISSIQFKKRNKRS